MPQITFIFIRHLDTVSQGYSTKSNDASRNVYIAAMRLQKDKTKENNQLSSIYLTSNKRAM
jgi:hypothetical protein